MRRSKNLIYLLLAMIFGMGANPVFAATACCGANKSQPNRIDEILRNLNASSKAMKTYRARVIYTNEQTLLESRAIRTGMLYFKEDGSSRMRVGFTTLKQDDEPLEKIREEYIFDGVNMTRINFQLKTIEVRQLSEPNNPLDAFELAGRYWPMVGFANVESIRKDFEIKLVQESEKIVQLRLEPKPGSRYSQDYEYINFWIDAQKWLPTKMSAMSPDEIAYEFELADAKANITIADTVFNVETDRDFAKNVIPLNAENGRDE